MYISAWKKPLQSHFIFSCFECIFLFGTSEVGVRRRFRAKNQVGMCVHGFELNDLRSESATIIKKIHENFTPFTIYVFNNKTHSSRCISYLKSFPLKNLIPEKKMLKHHSTYFLLIFSFLSYIVVELWTKIWR